MKVIEAGGNAVLGYSSHFDAEGDSGIVVRAYGTACILLKVSAASAIYCQSNLTNRHGYRCGYGYGNYGVA
jgi:hypothetical protein